MPGTGRVRTQPIDVALRSEETLEYMLEETRLNHSRVALTVDELVGPSGHPTVVLEGDKRNVYRLLRAWGYGHQHQPDVPTSWRCDDVQLTSV